MPNLSSLISSRNSIPGYSTTTHGITLPTAAALMTSPVGCVVVGETTNYCSASGCCCLWTVPSGVTQAQFQIWGAGGNSTSCNHSTCCAYGTGGGSGEYTYVLAAVSAGQTYTLCAGGGTSTTTGDCWSANAADGCNSFVCGSASTCILSCGGSSGWKGMNVACAVTLYPRSTRRLYTGFSQTGGGASAWWATSTDNCSGAYFGAPEFRCDGAFTGSYTTTNRIFNAAKVASIVGGSTQCGSGICYMCYHVPFITCDHSVCLQGTGWTGGSETGCYTNSCALWNRPGIGGPAPLFPCNGGAQGSSPDWGGRGRSGLIIVKFK